MRARQIRTRYNTAVAESEQAKRKDVLKFNMPFHYFPNLKSLREFITNNDYRGSVRIAIESRDEKPKPEICPEWKINLGYMDWFVFNDNFGTTERKSFVACFAQHVDELKMVLNGEGNNSK